ncbi:hypothetical protein B0H19DRAFT_1076570 [Mycena capillaripes]|nr:hypothetical protein B0H19DRAFT_1076570 [Mycena capillaripes]
MAGGIQFYGRRGTEINSRVVLGLAIPGVILTAALLILFGYAALNPASRRHLDRVSFRLLVYALVAHLVYGIVFLIGTSSARPGWNCELLLFFTKLSLMFSAGMFFCIALNLPLVLAYNANGQKMEKFYIFGTALGCLVCNIVPYATGNLGQVSLIYPQSLRSVNGSEACWYRSSISPKNTRWLVGTQTVWVLLASAGEVYAFLIIVGYFMAYKLDTRYFRTNPRLNTSASGDSPAPGSTIQMFRNIILRIGLYPLVSCLLNISTSALDLYGSLSDLVIYSARPLIYGLLAATDPALRHPESVTQFEPQARHAHLSTQCLSTVIEMPEEEIDFPAGFDKDGAREDPTSSVSRIVDGKEQPTDERYPPNPQIGIPITLPIQRASIDIHSQIDKNRIDRAGLVENTCAGSGSCLGIESRKILGREGPETVFLGSLERNDRTGGIREDDSPKATLSITTSLQESSTGVITEVRIISEDVTWWTRQESEMSIFADKSHMLNTHGKP